MMRALHSQRQDSASERDPTTMRKQDTHTMNVFVLVRVLYEGVVQAHPKVCVLSLSRCVLTTLLLLYYSASPGQGIPLLLLLLVASRYSS